MDVKDKVYDIDELVDWLPIGQISRSAEALNEWRSCEQVDNGDPSTSPPFWETDEDSDDDFKPSEMFVKFTWNIEKFSQLSKKELKSEVFEVNGYKWYILIYPQGSDVCNHLSLFLCVANHTQLLPGWGHFAQFTLAILNKDPKKHKFSDTLHRFCKKEHDWGWKKFIELSKLHEGFLVDDTLTIKAEVQIIRNKPLRPFRCLDHQYRRGLLGMYLSHVEQVCRKFVEDQKSKLRKLLKDKARWSSFCTFWSGLDQTTKLQMSCERADVVFKVVVKGFFVEKEVTSALVMDSLYSGLKALRMESKCKGRKENVLESMTNSRPIVYVDGDMFILADDLLSLLEKSPRKSVALKDGKESTNQSKAGSSGHDFAKDSTEWAEIRLTEIGRLTIEIFVLSHIFSQKIEVAYQEAVAAKIQEELIREEEEEREAKIEQKAKRQAADKEKRLKKKMNKQKRSSNGKDHRKGETDDLVAVDHEDYTQISEESVRVSGKSALQLDEVFNPSEGEADLRDNDDDDIWLTTEDIEGSPATEDSTISDTCLSGESSTTELGIPSFNDSMSSTPVDGVQPLELNVWDKGSVSDNGTWNVLARKKSQRRKGLSGQSKRTAETYREISVFTNEPGRGTARSNAFLSAQREQTFDGSLKNYALKHSNVDKIEHSTRQEGIQGSFEQFSGLEASNVRVHTNNLKSNTDPKTRRNGIQVQNSVASKKITVQVRSDKSLKNGNGDIPRQRLEEDNVKPLPRSSLKSLLDPAAWINSRPPSISQAAVSHKVGAETVGASQLGTSEQLPSRAASPSPVPQLLDNLNMPKAQSVSRPSSNGSVGDYVVHQLRTAFVLPVENSDNELVAGLTFGSLTPEVLLGPSQLSEASYARSPRFLTDVKSSDSSSLDQFAQTSRTIELTVGSTSERPASTIPSQTSKAPLDDFPHIDIINYLFDEETEYGQAHTSIPTGDTAFSGTPNDDGAYELPQYPYIPGYQTFSQQLDNNYANALLNAYNDRPTEYGVYSNGNTAETIIYNPWNTDAPGQSKSGYNLCGWRKMF